MNQSYIMLWLYLSKPLIISREQKGAKTKGNSVLHIDQGTGAPNEDIVQNHLT